MAPTASSTIVSPPVSVSVSNQNLTKIVTHQYRPEDLPQVIQLFKEGMLNYPKNQQDPRLHEYIANSLKTDLSDIEGTYVVPGGNFWIATPHEDPTHVVGMVGLEVKPNAEGELRRMSVKSTHRRYGVGRQLLSTLQHWAAEHQFHKIWLTTGSVMKKPREFYTSAGFVETDAYLIREEPPRYGVVKLEKMLSSKSFP